MSRVAKENLVSSNSNPFGAKDQAKKEIDDWYGSQSW
jgi:hypothetical protein